MKRIILMAAAFILALALCACNGGNPGTTQPPGNPTQAPASEPTQGQDGRGDTIPDDSGGDEYDEPNDAGWNMEVKTGVFYYLDGVFGSDSLFFYWDNTVDCDWPGEQWLGYPYSIDGDILTITSGEQSVSFTIYDDGDTLEGEYGRFVRAGDGRGDLIGSDPGDTENYDPYSDPGDGDDEWSDLGDGGLVEWWGAYAGSGYSIDITEVTGVSFYYAIRMITTTQNTVVTEGRAEIDETGYFAMSGDMGFSLYEDLSAIDIFASESSEWAELRGQYERID